MAARVGEPDVVVIGAGHNGLVAAANLARAGLRTVVLEANPTIGGAVRSGEGTLPGFRHDLYSAFYPLFPVGPIGQLPLERYGLTLCNFEHPYGGATPGGPGVSQATALEASVASFEAAAPGD